MKYGIEKVVRQSDLIEFSWTGCGGLRTVRDIDTKDQVDVHSIISCFLTNKKSKGLYVDVQYDYKYPIVFFKKVGLNYIAWIQFINGKWELINND